MGEWPYFPALLNNMSKQVVERIKPKKPNFLGVSQPIKKKLNLKNLRGAISFDKKGKGRPNPWPNFNPLKKQTVADNLLNKGKKPLEKSFLYRKSLKNSDQKPKDLPTPKNNSPKIINHKNYQYQFQELVAGEGGTSKTPNDAKKAHHPLKVGPGAEPHIPRPTSAKKTKKKPTLSKKQNQKPAFNPNTPKAQNLMGLFPVYFWYYFPIVAFFY